MTNALQVQSVSPVATETGETIINISLPINFNTMYSIIKGLASGDNTITVPNHPDSVSIVMFVPDPTEVIAVNLKGSGGDTGTTLSYLAPTIFPLSGQSSFILHAASTHATFQVVFM